MDKTAVKRYLPYITAILAFAIISIAYFAPQFSGKALRMNDIVQYEGSSKDIKDHNERYGEDPQWTGNMFSGMPASLISMRFDSQVIKKTFPVLEFMGRPASLIFISMVAFFLMLLMFGVNPWVGIVPSLAYGLSTYFFLIIGAGHITKMIALAYAPLMVGSVYFTLRRNMWLGSAITALFASLQIAANHPQITYYFGFVIIALWINELVRAYKEKISARFWKATGLLAIAGVLALGSNLAPLWYVNEYSKDSIRGGSELAQYQAEQESAGNGLDLEYATQWSYGVGESFNMLIPNLTGGSSEGNFSADGPLEQTLRQYGIRGYAERLPSYWGDQPYSAGPTYLGAVIIFLFVLSLLVLRPRSTIWIIAVSVLALLLSWGKNFIWFTELFFNYFPGYNKFRTVSMMLVVVEFTVPLLAAFGLNKIWKNGVDKIKLKRSVYIAFGITGGISLFFALFGSAVFNLSAGYDQHLAYNIAAQLTDDPAIIQRVMNEIQGAFIDERAAMLRADSWRSLLFIALAAATMLVFVWGKLRRGVLVAILAVLVCVDIVFVNLRFLPQSKFIDKQRTTIQATQADKYILEDDELGFRVLNLTVSPFQDATTSYFHRSVGGYHGAKMQRYQDLIEHYLGNPNSPVYNMLNTKYFIVADQNTGQLGVEVNPYANGPAWFVDSISWVEDAKGEIETLGVIDNYTEAVIDKRFSDIVSGFEPIFDSTAVINLVDYKPNHLTYKYTSRLPQLAVFSEIYYDKGWTAYVDGVETPHLRADYVLRSMVLPAGEHTVEFKFRAVRFAAISAVTLTFSIFIILSVVAAVIYTVKRNRKNRNETAGA